MRFLSALSIFIVLVPLSPMLRDGRILNNCSKNRVSQIHPIQDLSINKTIANPINLEYEFYNISKSEDGTACNTFVEKGKKGNKDGDYVWVKMVPIYSSSGFKYAFEYQMDFKDTDFKALIKWLQDNIGENVKGGSLDRPLWYKHEMSLSEVFEYCKNNNQKITMGYLNEKLEREAIIVIDCGSITTKTSAEIGLVYLIH